MPKLPGIDYAVGRVSTLGREDVDAPGRLQRAKGAAIHSAIRGGVDIYKTVQANNAMNEAAGISSEITESMAELNAKIKGTSTYKPEELDELGIEFDREKGGVERKIIPASEVAGKVYKKSAASIKSNFMQGVDSRAGKLVNKVYAQLYKEGIGKALNHGLRFANTESKIKAYVGFEKAVTGGNIEGATMIARTALGNGTWSESEYMAKVEPMADRVANQDYLRQVDLANDAAAIESIRGKMLYDPNLKHTSKKSLYATLGSAEQRMIKGQERTLKARKIEESSATLTNYTSQILGSKTPVAWDEVPELTAGMTPPDTKAFIAVNRSIHDGTGKVSDPEVLKDLTIAVKTLSLPIDDGVSTIFQRREQAVNNLVKQLGDGNISTTDFSKLVDSVNKSQGFAYDNPDVKAVDEEIWLTLTGGSKDIISQIFGGGESKINVVNASHELNKAARQSGPGFDPYVWWETNEKKYLVPAIKANRESLQKDIAKGYVIKGSDGFVDMESTRKSLQLMVKSEEMSQDRMNEILNTTKIRNDADKEWRMRQQSKKFK